jgi:hypothetical protein
MEINEFGQLVDTHNSLVSARTTAQLLDKFGLNWVVEKQPLLLPSGSKSGLFGIVRKDTDTCFTSASEQYEVFQNDELADLVQEVGHVLGVDVSKGGMFNGGGKVFLQLPFSDKQIGGDTIKRYATALNSHDGTTALKWGATNVTISCANTFNAASKSMENSVRHYKNMRQAVEASLRAVKGIQEQDETLFERFSRMADKKATPSDVKRVIQAVTGVDVTMSVKEAENAYSTRLRNQAQDLTTSITREMSYKGDTLWGLFSGVTHYTTHKAGRVNSREVSKMAGALQKTDQKVFDLVDALV